MSITIIIPTTNYRNKLVLRALSYYRKHNQKVIVLDNSIKATKFPLTKNENYYHLPNKDFIDRIIIGIKKSKTKYIAVCQDDDFLNIPSLKYAEKFMNKNSSFVFVNGIDIYFENFLNRLQLTKVYNDLSYNKLCSKDLYKRFKEIRSSKTQMTASLFKRSKIERAMIDFKKLNLNKNLKLKLYDEILFSNFPIIYGRYKFISKIWQIRDRSVYPYINKKNNIKISRPNTVISKKDFLNLKETKKLKLFFFKSIKKEYKNFIDYIEFEKYFDSSTSGYNVNSLEMFNLKIKIKKYFNLIFLLLKNIKKIFLFFLFNRSKTLDKSIDKFFFNSEWKLIKNSIREYKKDIDDLSLN